METKFTKEKWIRQGTTVYALHQTGWNKGTLLMSNRFYAQVYPDYRIDNADEEAESNAKLIAAAPDMIKMLISINETLLAGINIHYEDTIHENIQKLIKKATE